MVRAWGTLEWRARQAGACVAENMGREEAKEISDGGLCRVYRVPVGSSGRGDDRPLAKYLTETAVGV